MNKYNAYSKSLSSVDLRERNLGAASKLLNLSHIALLILSAHKKGTVSV